MYILLRKFSELRGTFTSGRKIRHGFYNLFPALSIHDCKYNQNKLLNTDMHIIFHSMTVCLNR